MQMKDVPHIFGFMGLLEIREEEGGLIVSIY